MAAPEQDRLTRDDRPLVLGLLRAMDVVETGRAVTQDADARALLEDPSIDLATDSTVLRDGTGRAMGFAVVRTLAPRPRVRVTLGVEPAAVADVAPVLLRRATARAAAAADDLGGEAEAETWQLPDALLAPALLAAGWRTDRRFARLHGDPRGRTRAPLPDGVRLETGFDDRRAAAVHAVLEAALADSWNHRARPLALFLEEERRADGYAPDLWYLATVDGLPAGALVARLPEGEGWIAALGTLAPHRGRGVGGLLLSAVLADLAARGATAVELDVDTGNTSGALRLYEAFGLQPRYRSDRWRIDLRPAGRSEG